jgi:hypothetical protein
MLGGASLLGYKLDHRRHAVIRQALDARDAGLGAEPQGASATPAVSAASTRV